MIIKHTHREKVPWNKTPARIKGMNMDIWLVGTSNQVFLRGSYTETKISKNKVVTRKIRFYVIGRFCVPRSICLNRASDRVAFCGLVTFSILLKLYSSLMKKDFVFQKIRMINKVLKTFKISIDCHIKACLSLKRRTI